MSFLLRISALLILLTATRCLPDGPLNVRYPQMPADAARPTAERGNQDVTGANKRFVESTLGPSSKITLGSESILPASSLFLIPALVADPLLCLCALSAFSVWAVRTEKRLGICFPELRLRTPDLRLKLPMKLFQPLSAKTPIVLIFPGFNNSPKTWEGFRSFLERVKHRTAFAVDYTAVNMRPIAEMCAAAKKHVLQLVDKHSEEFAERGVVLFGHSMGGLVAREFLGQMDDADWRKAPVRRLVTVGTPNAGFYTRARGVSGALKNAMERSIAQSNLMRRRLTVATIVNDPYRPHLYSKAAADPSLAGVNAVAVVNNQVQGVLSTADGQRRRRNMLRLRDGMCVIGSAKDAVIRPVASQIFGFYRLEGEGRAQRLQLSAMEATPLFQADADPIALRALDAAGKLMRVWRTDMGHKDWHRNYNGLVDKLPRGGAWLEQRLDVLSKYV